MCLHMVGVIALSEALAVSQSLEILDLRHNRLDAAGLMALSRTCEHSKALLRVFIDEVAVCT